MKNTLFVILSLAGIAALSPVSAQVYQWKDANGRTVVSDTPPPGNARGAKSVSGGTAAPLPQTPAAATAPASPAPGAAPAAPMTTAEKDLEFKKRQQEAKEKAQQAAKEEAAAAERKANCERAKSAQATLESGVRVATMNAKGERSLMDDTQRQQELDRARKAVAESCK